MSGYMQRPCPECPFTRGPKAVRLTRGRVRELAANALSWNGGSFPCHKTVDYSDGDGERTPQSKECAGHILFADKQGRANQWLRIMGRLGLDPSTIDGRDDVFNSTVEMLRSAIK